METTFSIPKYVDITIECIEHNNISELTSLFHRFNHLERHSSSHPLLAALLRLYVATSSPPKPLSRARMSHDFTFLNHRKVLNIVRLYWIEWAKTVSFAHSYRNKRRFPQWKWQIHFVGHFIYHTFSRSHSRRHADINKCWGSASILSNLEIWNKLIKDLLQ